MSSMFLRLLTLLALVLMPFGMGGASAVPAHHAPAAAAAGHCDEQGQPVSPSDDAAIGCAMACSMVATTQAGLDESGPSVRPPAALPLVERGSGLHPETATPPPKRS